MKVAKTKEIINNKEVTTFFVDGIKIATSKKYTEWFCTVKKGQRSTIRDKSGTVYSSDWNISGLEKVFNTKIDLNHFKDSHPDLMWGYKGSAFSLAKVKKTLIEFKTKIEQNN